MSRLICGVPITAREITATATRVAVHQGKAAHGRRRTAPWQTEPVQPVGVHHVAINVNDVSASVDFYTGVLGLTRRTDRPDLGLGGAWLDAGGQQVHLLRGAGAAQPRPALRPVGSTTSTAWWRSFVAKGVEVSDPGGIGAGRQAFLLDPSGNAVELHQRV